MTLAHLMENAEERGRKEGMKEGRAEGVERVNQLIQALIQAGRLEDLEKASRDADYQERLFEEFNL